MSAEISTLERTKSSSVQVNVSPPIGRERLPGIEHLSFISSRDVANITKSTVNAFNSFSNKLRNIVTKAYAFNKITVQEIEDKKVVGREAQFQLVSKHEAGHVLAGAEVGLRASMASCEPGAGYSGITVYSNARITKAEDCFSFAVAAAGGELAEEMYGEHDHSGCGSDRFKGKMMSNIVASVTNSSTASVQMSASMRASTAIRSYAQLEATADHIYARGTVYY